MIPRLFSFTFLWALASAGGLALGGGCGWLLLAAYLGVAPAHGSPDLLTVLLVMPAVGLGLGLGQYLLLAGKVRRAAWWLPVTALGWLLGLSVDFTLNRMGIASQWIAYGLGGLYLGALQWLVLYLAGVQRRAPWAALWPPASVLAWVIVYPFQDHFNGPIQTLTRQAWGGAAGAILTWALAGLVLGALTGPLMAWILLERQPPPAPAPARQER